MVFVSSKEGTNFGKDTTFCTTMIMMCRKKGGFMGRKSVFLLHLSSRMGENAHCGVQNGAIAVRTALQSKALAHRRNTVARQRTTANVSSRWDIRLFGKIRSFLREGTFVSSGRDIHHGRTLRCRNSSAPETAGAVRGRKTKRDVRAHGRGNQNQRLPDSGSAVPSK